MERIGIIGLDLDGTLLNNNKQISQRNYEVLSRAAERGVYLVPVTGRPHFGIPALVRQLPFVRYVISCNGAAIRDEREGVLVREETIAPSVAADVVACLLRHRVPFEVLYQGRGYAEQWVYDLMIARSPNNSFLPKYIQETRTVVPDLPQFLAEGNRPLEELFIMAHNRETRDEVAEELASLAPLNLVFPAPAAVEITAPGVDKGEALLHLAARLGIGPEGVMAIGDSGNDLAMLRAAALPVAMGNAPEEVRRAAVFTTATNEEDGVALAIERFVLHEMA